MKVTGDEWDAPVLAELLRLGVGPAGGAASLETARAVLLDEVGGSVARFAAASLPGLAPVLGLPAAAAARELLDSLAWYFVVMAGLMAEGEHRRIVGWDEAVRRVRDRAGVAEAAIYVSMQVGLPLLTPLLVAEATRRPTAVYMHRRNAPALDLMTRAAAPIRVLDVEQTEVFEVLALARAGWNIVANIDTAYDGARSAPIELIGRRLLAPAGVLRHIPRRSGLALLGVTLRLQGAGVVADIEELAAPGCRDDEAVRARTGAFFDAVVRAAPLQWSGWPSLR